MDTLKDALDLVETHIGTYSEWFTSSLRSPTYVAMRALRWNDRSHGTTASQGERQFLTILVISAFLGATVGGVIPGRPPLKDRLTVAVVVVLAWLFVSVCTHVFTRLFRGKASLGVTVRAMMQLLALAYVTSNFVSLLVTGAAILVPRLHAGLADIGFKNPGTILVATQFAFLALYVPLTLRSAHETRGLFAGAAVTLLAAVLASVMATLLVAQGNC